MEKNIMLLFLSTFNTDRATGKLINSTYHYIDDTGKEQILNGNHTNEPALRISAQAGLDRVFAFATQSVCNDFTYTLPDFRKRSCTHLVLFQEIIGAKVPGLVERFTLVDYDENGEEQQDMACVLRMSSAIKDYLQSEQKAGNTVNLYVDMTGGMRNANMLMLIIIQLMKYSGINMKKVFYTYYYVQTKTGWVKDITSVNNLSTLVSGAEAFVRYGRSDVLESYFALENKSPSLERLLKAMSAWADALSMCSTGIVGSALQELGQALEAFVPGSNEEQAFAVLLNRIKAEYAPLLQNPDSPIAMIRWCLEKSLLQQAMTFYTEMIPQYMVSSGIYAPANEKIKIGCQETTQDYTPWEKHFLTNYSVKSSDLSSSGSSGSSGVNIAEQVKSAREFLKICVDGLGKNKKLIPQRLEYFFPENPAKKELFLQLLRFDEYRAEGLKQLNVRLETYLALKMGAAFKIVEDQHRKMRSNGFKKTLDEFLRHRNNTARIFNSMTVYNSAEIEELFEISRPEPVQIAAAEASAADVPAMEVPDEEKFKDKKIERKINNRCKTLQNWLVSGGAITNCTLEQAMRCARTYQVVRSMRNNVNHASKGIVITRAEVKNRISKGLEDLELAAKQ